jgi:SAM-dependent methyltransferase
VPGIELKPVVKGIAMMVPGAHRLLPRRGGGGTASADYCYGVWLKHLTLLWQTGMREIPRAVVELGPGDSLGTGLCALLSGASRFYALDVIQHSTAERDLQMLDELVERFAARAPRPNKGWPDFDELLGANLFPEHILTEERLAKALAPGRVAAIREAIARPDPSNDIMVRYVVPWNDVGVLPKGSIDLIYSHAVFQHVTDVPAVLRCCAAWLREGGWMSHQMAFISHGITKEWNGHWQYPDWLWKIVTGARPYLINRHPASAQVRMLDDAGFEVCLRLRDHRADGLHPRELRAAVDEADARCCGLFVQARKRRSSA